MLPGEEPLPVMDSGIPLDQLEAMNGVSMAEEDMMAADMPPEEIVNDVASMELPQTGVGFDFSSINVQTREDFDRLPPEQQELLKAMKRGVQFTPESAAQFVTAQMTRRQKLDDQSKTPQGKLAQRRIEQMDKEAMTARRDTMLTAQSMLDAASRIEQAVDNNLVGPWKDVEQKFDGSGLPFSDPDEYSQRKALEVQTKKSIIDAVQAFKGPLSDSDRKFFIEMFPTINEPVGVWKDYASQLKNKFSPIVKGQFDMPNAPQSQQRATPSFKLGDPITDKFGNVRIFRGMDQSGKPILDPVQ